MKRGSSFRERWKGSGKFFVHRSGKSEKKLRLTFIEWLAWGYLESTPEKCSEQNITDDDEEELDNSFKHSTLRRSFRRMRKAVKWDIMWWIFAEELRVFNIILRSVSSPLMSHRTGLGMTKAQSMSALPGGLMSIMTNVNDLCISPSEAASPYR